MIPIRFEDNEKCINELLECVRETWKKKTANDFIGWKFMKWKLMQRSQFTALQNKQQLIEMDPMNALISHEPLIIL